MIVAFDTIDAVAAKDHPAYGEVVRLAQSPACHKYTQFDKESVTSILFFQEFEQGEFAAFIILLGQFRAIHAREIKRFIAKAKEHYKAKKVWACSTVGKDIKWHKFFGFNESNECIEYNGDTLMRWEC